MKKNYRKKYQKKYQKKQFNSKKDLNSGKDFSSGKDILRLISLGGFNQVTQNMFVYHFLPQGKEVNDQILIVDCGVGFPEEDLFGVDLIIPDFSYLEKRKGKIVGLAITHGHEDHLGGLPFFLSQIKANFPIYAPRLAKEIIEEKLIEFRIKEPIRMFQDNDQLKLGRFVIEPIRVTHSIPDTFHFFIRSPIGNFYHGSDFKFDLSPLDGKASDLDRIGRLSQEGVKLLLSDCLGSEHEGHSPSEKEIAGTIETEIKKAKGRVLLTALSSNIYRWQQAIDASKKFGRKIALVGMSVEKNIKIAQKLGYLNLKDSDLVRRERIKNYPDRQLTLLVGGSLGQSGSSLERIIFDNHRIALKPTDKVIFSSPDYIPGTTEAIFRMIDNLAKKGIDVIYSEVGGKIHVSGHGSQQELALLIDLVKPQWFLPIGGNYRHMRRYASLVEKMNLDPKRVIIPDENQALLFDQEGLLKQRLEVPTRKVLVDGLGVGDVGKIVLRDRRVLAEEGMVVIIFLVDYKAKKLTTEPYVVSRGFVYVKESQRLIKTVKQLAKKVFQENINQVPDLSNLRELVQGKIEKEIYRQTERQPMVLPLMIEV